MDEESSIGNIQELFPFLKLYPFPAWISGSVGSRRGALALEPAWSNAPFNRLFGSHEAFLSVLASDHEHLTAYGSWLEGEMGVEDNDKALRTFRLFFTLKSEKSSPGDLNQRVELTLARTRCRDAKGKNFVICTSTSNVPLPHASGRDDSAPTTQKRRKQRALKLHDLPSFRSMGTRTSPLSSSANSSSNPTVYPSTGGPGGGPRMVDMVESFPWETTPLGPREQWDPCLRQAVDLTLKYPYPAALWTGPELVMIYNDAYAVMSTTKHPRIFGQRGEDAWGELWEALGPALRECLDGRTVYKVEDRLFMERLDSEQPLEETYHSWCWVPIITQDGKFGGLFNTTMEMSAKVIAERRLSTLHALGSRAAIAQDSDAFCDAVITTLDSNQFDIPFALIYISDAKTVDIGDEEAQVTPQGTDAPQRNLMRAKRLRLRRAGTVGIKPGANTIPEVIDVVISSVMGFDGPPVKNQVWPIEQAFHTRESIRATVPKDYRKTFEDRGWGDATSEAIVVPLSSESDATPLGVAIIGLNTRRNFDLDYSKWIDVLRAAMSSHLTGAIAREEEVRRAENLAELDAAKTALFSNASHELRTPLTLIAGPIAECMDDIKEPKVKNKLQMAARNVDRLARLVDSLMDFSRLEAGRMEGRYYPVSYGPYVRELAEVFRPVIEKASLQYEILYDSEETRLVFIDQDYMEKIIFNLIGNAFKYTLIGGISVEVTYSETHVSLVVSDTGVGIPPQDIGKIWDRFHRVDATSRSHEGTGIGLSLTKQFVLLHGGTINVQSFFPISESDAHGSVFTVTFPLGKDHLPATRIAEASIPSKKQNYARGIVAEASRWKLLGDTATPSDSDESYSSSDGQRSADVNFDSTDLILLADDNQDMLEYIKNIFARYCRVKTATNGQLALEMARESPPNLIITDVMMPVLDGFGLVNAAKEDSSLSSIPIILLTARAADSNRAEGILSGADDYIAKPFSSRELLARANFQVQLGKRRREMESQFKQRTTEVQILGDMSPTGLFRIDTEGSMLICNDRYRELSGMEGAHENDWLEFVHEDYRLKVEQAVQKALDDRCDGQIDFVFSNGNWVKGHLRWWDLGLVGAATDMSLTRLYEESLTRRAEEAEERRVEAEERRRGQELLVDVTSHELRQPVSAVINCASVVFGNMNKWRMQLGECAARNEPYIVTPAFLEQVDEDLESLNAIELCGLAQGHIVNDILTLSRMQLHMLTLQDSVFPLVREVRQVCSILFNEMKSKGITHTLKFGDSVRSLGIKFVTVDKVRFGQVIINLLSNAIRFSQVSEKKGIDVTVDVSKSAPIGSNCLCPVDHAEDLIPVPDGARVPIYVYLSVHDTGPGLQPKDLEVLFQRFQKGTNSEEIFGGSGLGLFVSRKICDLLGGRIEVDANSVGNQGSTFRFYVRMTTAPAPLQLAPRNISPEEASTALPLRVLVAEDNHVNRTILSRQLKSNNCIPSLAVNGAEAVDFVVKAGDETFDCILMDCEMPVMSGLEATREIRRLEQGGQVPPQRIIALTGNARSEQLESALAAGMDEVMTKPYRLTDLLERIRNPLDSNV